MNPDSLKPESTTVAPKRRWLRRLTLLAFVSLLAVAGLYAFRGSVLLAVGGLWMVEDPIKPSDAALVLGGGVPYRAAEAARLYRAGLVKKVLVLDVKISESAKLGLIPTEADLTRQTLRIKGVPASDIVTVGHSVATTWQDISATREWAESCGARSIMMPADIFHTRRVRWICNRILKPAGITTRIVAISTPPYSAANWWHEEAGVIDFQNELVKFAYYQVKYFRAKPAETQMSSKGQLAEQEKGLVRADSRHAATSR